jgi:hypothetical protein
VADVTRILDLNVAVGSGSNNSQYVSLRVGNEEIAGNVFPASYSIAQCVSYILRHQLSE